MSRTRTASPVLNTQTVGFGFIGWSVIMFAMMGYLLIGAQAHAGEPEATEQTVEMTPAQRANLMDAMQRYIDGTLPPVGSMSQRRKANLMAAMTTYIETEEEVEAIAQK